MSGPDLNVDLDDLRSPFVGGRPYEVADRGRFFERNVAVDRIADRIRAHQVLELLAESGAGKTSVLEAGVRPRLEEQGRLWLQVRQWRDVSADQPYLDALQRGIAHEVEVRRARQVAVGGEGDLDRLEQLGTAIAELADQVVAGTIDGEHAVDQAMAALDGVVVVFDQFESLIRWNPRTADRLMTHVGSRANRLRLPVRHVFSLRSEYRQRLNVLEAVCPVGVVELPPLSEKGRANSLRKLAGSGIGGSVLDEPASELLDQVLAAAAPDDGPAAADLTGAGAAMGSLHLQVLNDGVWHSWWRAARQPGASRPKGTASDRGAIVEVGVDEVREALCALAAGELRRTGRPAPVPSDFGGAAGSIEQDLAQAALTGAFQEAVQRALEPCAQGEVALDVASALGSMLSVQGYKVAQTRAELGRRVFETERRLLGPSFVEGGSTEVVDDAPSRPDESGGQRDNRSGWAHSLSVPAVGRALRASFDEVLERLAAGHIIRDWSGSEEQGDGSVVELVHDGWGRPLERWAEQYRSGVRWVTGRAVVVLGMELNEEVTPATLGPACPIDETGRAIVRHVRLRGSWLSPADPTSREPLVVSDVVFEGCDLRGTGISQARLKRVRFRDCQLDGVLFDRCEFDDVEFVEGEASRVPRLSAMIFRRCRLAPGPQDEVPPPALVLRGEGGNELQVRNVSFELDGGHVRFAHADLRQVRIAAISDGLSSVEDPDTASCSVAVLDCTMSQPTFEGAVTVGVTRSRLRSGVARPLPSGPGRPLIELPATADDSEVDLGQYPSSDQW